MEDVVEKTMSLRGCGTQLADQILRLAGKEHPMKVEKLMSKPAVTCREYDFLSTVAGSMWDQDIGALPVLDDSDTVVGMITDRDICMAAYTKGQRLDEIRVSEISSGKVFSVSPTDSIQTAEKVMRKHQVRRVPVIDEFERLLGVLSLNDIAREGDSERTQKKQEIGSEEVLHTLAAICESNSKLVRARG